MSELSREQVVEITGRDKLSPGDCIHLRGTDAALRAKLEEQTKRADENQRKYETQCVGTKSRLDEISSLNAQVTSWRTVLNNEREAAQQRLEAMTQERDEQGKLKAAQYQVCEELERRLTASEQRFQAAETERIEWVQRGERAEQQLAEAHNTIARLGGEKADMVLRNKLLRDRPDLSMERVEAYEQFLAAYDQLQATVTAQQEEIGRLKS